MTLIDDTGRRFRVMSDIDIVEARGTSHGEEHSHEGWLFEHDEYFSIYLKEEEK